MLETEGILGWKFNNSDTPAITSSTMGENIKGLHSRSSKDCGWIRRNFYEDLSAITTRSIFFSISIYTAADAYFSKFFKFYELPERIVSDGDPK